MLKPRVLAIVFIVFSFALPSFAAQVLKVKGSAVLIDTAGDNLKMGSTYYLMSGAKKKGIIRIIKLRPGQAIGKLLKGKALPNWVLKKRSKGKAKQVAKKRKPKAPEPKSMYSKKKRKKKPSDTSQSKLAIGFAIGMNQNSSQVTFSGANPRVDEYSGSSSSFEILADYKLYTKFHLRGSLGMQNFNAGGDPTNNQCTDSQNQTGQICLVDLGYMNLDIWLRYQAFQYGRFDFWAGAGLGILFSPKYNSTTALNEDDLATTTFMQIGGGADIKLTERLYVPLWAEYGLYPSSDTVKMTAVSFYFGLSYRL